MNELLTTLIESPDGTDGIPSSPELDAQRELLDYLSIEWNFDRLADEIGVGIAVSLTEAAPFILSAVPAEIAARNMSGYTWRTYGDNNA